MSLLGRALSAGLLVLAAAALALAVATPLDLEPQLAVGAVVLAAAILLRRSGHPAVTPVLTMLSVVASSRYIYWRLTTTIDFDSTFDRVAGGLLVAAELYAYAILLLGAFQTVRALERKPVPLPADRAAWPTMDVYIPSYNEPLEVVRPTVLAALALDWPADKLKVYLLDDGKRREFREFAARARVEYVIRPDNKHAKAGNLNHALAITKGELVVIFDCDHVTTRSFLQMTAGWFLRDPKLAMLQTPHHFYNADPIERNTAQFRRVPNEGELFYGLIQSGNDFWNATFFCGSCAVIRRSALEEVGGIATGSVTEDALTSLKLQRLGYRTAYLNVRQAGGLATDTLAAHIGQRIRWAQGMAQILRIDNPLLGPGLSFGQRLCYLNAGLHFLYGLPRLIFILGPLAYLILGAHVCSAEPAILLAYLAPHLLHSMLVDARTKSRFRYAFWNNVYETVLAVYIAIPTLVALIKPRAGVFKVTDKGIQIETGGFDRKVARPYLVLLLLSFSGVVFALTRLVLWDYYSPGTVIINLAWSLFSIFTLGAVLAVAWETRQLRRTHRLPMRLQAMVRNAAGRTSTGETRDLSLGGAALALHDEELALAPGDAVQLTVFHDQSEWSFSARVAGASRSKVRLTFEPLSIKHESDLVQLLFGRPDAWLDWDRGRPEDRPLASLATLLKESSRGILEAARAERRLVAGAGACVLALATFFLLMHTGWRLEPVLDRVTALRSYVADRVRSAAEVR
jgi:cellulose synthase (UDP-forming)